MRPLATVCAALAGLLVPLALTACGDEQDPFDSYCSVVAEQKVELARLLEQDDGSSGLLPGLPVFERLEDAAPDDIADDWSVVVQRLSALSEALEAAGVDPTTYDPADPPDGLTDEEQKSITLAAGGVAVDAVSEALGNVEQQARDVCKTELL